MSNKEDLPVVVEKQKVQVKPKAKLGRPRKEDIKKAKLPVGRPKNDTGRIAEFKQRLLGTSGENVIKKIIEIGQTDGHPGQMAALKMAVDRILPLSLFEKDSKGQRNAIQINITGIGEAKVESTADVVDMEEDIDESEL
jgi:hypothetical protein